MVISQDVRQTVRAFAAHLQLPGPELPCDVDLIEKVLHLFSPFVQTLIGWSVFCTSKFPSTCLIDPSKPVADGDFIEPSPRDLADPFLDGLQRSRGRRETLARQPPVDRMPLFLKLTQQHASGGSEVSVLTDT